jgi:hypothetical protein
VAFSLPDPPELDIRKLPEPEIYEAGHLLRLLDDLRSYTIEFEGAVRILDLCMTTLKTTYADTDLDEYWLWSHGRHIPARDAALTVYHYGCTLMTSIPSALRRCPTISALGDHQALRAVRREFQERMENYTLLRHAVSHRAEMRETIERQQSHAAPNLTGGQREIVWGKLEGHSLVFTIDGKWARLPVTMSTHRLLADFTVRTFAALPQTVVAAG